MKIKAWCCNNVAAFPLPSQSTLICSQWCWCNCSHKDSVNKLTNSLMLSTSCSIVREGECKLLKMLASEPPDCILRQEIQLKHAQIYIYSEAEVQSAKHCLGQTRDLFLYTCNYKTTVTIAAECIDMHIYTIECILTCNLASNHRYIRNAQETRTE